MTDREAKTRDERTSPTRNSKAGVFVVVLILVVVSAAISVLVHAFVPRLGDSPEAPELRCRPGIDIVVQQTAEGALRRDACNVHTLYVQREGSYRVVLTAMPGTPSLKARLSHVETGVARDGASVTSAPLSLAVGRHSVQIFRGDGAEADDLRAGYTLEVVPDSAGAAR